jgi:hypothetical protein
LNKFISAFFLFQLSFQKAKYFSHLQLAVFAISSFGIIENVSYAQGATNMHLQGFLED